MKLILRELENGPATAYELAEVLGLHIRNVRPYMKLLEAEGFVRIMQHEVRKHTPGPNPPIYAKSNTHTRKSQSPAPTLLGKAY